MPAASSSESVRYLSTAASTARGGFRTGTPAAAIRCKASMRKTTCSRLPGGIIRTSTPSVASRSSPPAVTLERRPAVARRSVPRSRSPDHPDARRDPREFDGSQRNADLLGRAFEVGNMPAKSGDQGTKRCHELDLI